MSTSMGGASPKSRTLVIWCPDWPAVAAARQARTHPAAWFAMADIYGELAQSQSFAAAFASALQSLWANGTKATLTAYLEGTR